MPGLLNACGLLAGLFNVGLLDAWANRCRGTVLCSVRLGRFIKDSNIASITELKLSLGRQKH